MSSVVLSSLHPVAIIQDRYGGTYSSGNWLALANADEEIGTASRAAWVVQHGPYGDDLDAREFWSDPPGWMAVGDTPD